MNGVKMIPAVAWFEDNLKLHNGLYSIISNTNQIESQHGILNNKTLHYVNVILLYLEQKNNYAEILYLQV